MATKRGGEDAAPWETNEAQDVVFSEVEEDGFDPSSQLLEVPVLTQEALDAMETQVNGPTPQEAASVNTQHGEPGSYVNCDNCGKRVRVKRDGDLSQHRCEAPSQRGNRFDHLPAPKPAPKKVRDFSINVLAWSIEEGSAQVLARATNTNAEDVPSELPDAEEMIGPALDIVWPHIPDSAQDLIATLADNSQLISCVLLWAEWAKTLGSWTREMRQYQQSLYNQQQGETGYASPQSQPTNQYGTVTPFRPAQPQ